MIEIIIAIILQITTVAGGTNSDKEKAEKLEKDEKGKKELIIKTDGGQTGWEG